MWANENASEMGWWVFSISLLASFVINTGTHVYHYSMGKRHANRPVQNGGFVATPPQA